jgi:hypothetical protein
MNVAEEKGELIAESSAEITKMLRDRFRAAAAFYALPGVLLVIIGLALWLWLDLAWYMYVIFFIGAAILFLYSITLLSVSVGVPSLKIYEGGVLLKPPKGRTRFHPWGDFKGYRLKRMGELEVIELHREGGEPISIHKFIPQYGRVLALVKENVPVLD